MIEAIVYYTVGSFVLGAGVYLAASIEADVNDVRRNHPLYPGRREGEKGIVALCRWSAIFVTSPFIIAVVILWFLAIAFPEVTEWLMEEPEQ